MPQISKYADIVAGNARAVSLNGHVIASRGTLAGFLDATRLIYQRRVGVAPERWALETYDLATQQYQPVRFGEGGANELAAGGGRWMAFADGRGVYDPTGTVFVEAGLAGVGTDGRGAAGHDGTIGFVRDRQHGRGLQLLAPNGEVITSLPDIAIPTLAIFDRHLVVWVEGGQIRAWGRPHPAPQPEPVSRARAVYVGGEWLLLVTTNDRLWLRRWDRPVGTIVVPTPTAFHADAVALAPSVVRVVSSRTDGERPEDIEPRNIDIARLVDPITVVAPAPQPPQPPSGDDDMHAPKVDIKSYDPVIASGKPWRLIVVDPENGQTFTVEKRANDSVHVGIKNAKGEDVSGRLRPVKVGR